MNYLRQIVAFEAWCETRGLPMVAQVLWYKLMFVANKCGWCEWVGVDNQRLMWMIGTTSKHTLMRARDALIEAEMIEYRKGKKGKPSMYKLLEISEQRIFGADMAPYTAPQTAPYPAPYVAPQTAPIIKQKTKTETEISPPTPQKGERIDYGAVVEMFHSCCPSLPKVRDLTDARKKAIAARVKDHNTLDDFRAVFKAVERSSFLTGRSGSWHGCGFDWILKPSNWQKIKEGNYEDRPTGNGNAAGAGTPAAGSRDPIGLVL